MKPKMNWTPSLTLTPKTNTEIKYKPEAKTSKAKELTWRGILTIAIPEKISEITQHIYMQLRPWSESKNLKWKMIIQEASMDEDETPEKYDRAHRYGSDIQH